MGGGGNRGTLSIQSKLDRCFGNKSWFQLFPASNQVFMDKSGSDHRPVMVKLFSTSQVKRGQFRFNGRFLHKNGVREEIKKAWSSNHPLIEASVSDRLKRCRKALSKWKKKENLNSRDKIKQIQCALEKEQSLPGSSKVRINFLKSELVKAYKEEEVYWQQRCKEKWATKGDLNTRYYHAAIKFNRARKQIIKLRGDNGQDRFSEEAKGEVASDYFRKMFKSTNGRNFSELFEGFPRRVSPSMNESLSKDVSYEEVKDAVFSINPGSAPGHDGMTGLFFQKYWEIIGNHVILEVREFFSSGIFPSDWNFTHICLLPKIDDPILMSDLRLISLCSVLYKIISKIMVSRLKPMMADIVSPTHSAFVEERLITDNILIAHEVIHALRTNDQMSSGFMAIKSDMLNGVTCVLCFEHWGLMRTGLIR